MFDSGDGKLFFNSVGTTNNVSLFKAILVFAKASNSKFAVIFVWCRSSSASSDSLFFFPFKMPLHPYHRALVTNGAGDDASCCSIVL